jgi:hypothetical protein
LRLTAFFSDNGGALFHKKNVIPEIQSGGELLKSSLSHGGPRHYFNMSFHRVMKPDFILIFLDFPIKIPNYTSSDGAWA